MLLLGIVAGGYVLVLAILFAGQRQMVFVPDPAAPALPPDLAARGVRAMHVPAMDGTPLLVWVVPAGPGERTMLYLHGNGGNLGDRAARVRALAGQGFGLMLLEWRGYGGNPGAPSEAGFVSDAHGAMAALAAQGAGPEQVILYGESVGSGIAVRIAAERRVAALVLESPYTSLLDLARARFWWAPVGWLMRDPVQALPLMPAVRAPVLVIQGARDTIVPPAMGRAMAAASPGAQLWTAPEGGHNDLAAHGAMAVVLAFLRR